MWAEPLGSDVGLAGARAVGELGNTPWDALTPSAWLPPSSPPRFQGFCPFKEDLAVLRDKGCSLWYSAAVDGPVFAVKVSENWL